ncbi:MAG: UDP-2,3-diacylglucosamine diphosphatase LpxI [Proteobacteria bacterium]|nr:UDP-2,3-diacylglucosamine diphosphatase LpxI [Pseudomonadota bacterium]MBU1419123.1 UDP-2,3-diacylglucosamine diphosphatase LpxI [Pseudomonadota bacterium]MBU1455979.1 UDP-2,3-diacylglucosamine diphosphatase LpxI [Pseudomonadota bacterium]
MKVDSAKIGVIAGSGQFPLLFIEAARKAGRKVVLVAHRNETSQEVADAADEVLWVKLGQLGKMIKFFHQQGVGETVFVGAITKTRIFRDILPDLKGMSLWNKIDTRQDDAILRAVAGALEKEGVKVLESTLYLRHLLFPQGVLTQKKPDKNQRLDIEFGWKNARAIGGMDIGQCVVVRNLTVVAVEAIEGTDVTIARGGALAKEKAVVVKVKKPNQDFRFDLPATGIKTIETLASVKGAVLAVEAGQSLIFDREATVKAADEAGIVVVGIKELPDGSLEF